MPLLVVFSAEVHGGAGARGAVPALCPEWRSDRDSEAPHVQDQGGDIDQHQLQRYMITTWE